MSNFLIFKAAFNNSATPAIGTYTAEGATALFNRNASINPAYYLYNTADDTAVQWFVPTAETTDFEFVADILTRQWTNRVTYFIIADSTGTTRLRMWSQNDNWHFENSDSIEGPGDPEHIGVIDPTTSGGFDVFHQFRVRVRKLTASSSSVEVYVDGTLKLTATAGAALVTCAKIGFVGGVDTSGPGTGAGAKNAYVYDLSGGELVDRGVLSEAFNRLIDWNKGNYVPRSGGAVMTRYFLGKTTSTSSFIIGGGTTSLNGASIEVFGSNGTGYFAGAVALTSVISSGTSASIYFEQANLFRPSENGTITLGSGRYRWGQIYSSNSAISTSDSRLKNTISSIDDKLLDAWESIQPKQYKFNDATEKKGEKARYHTGYLAQDIQAECEKHGINAADYGLFCYDEWEEQEEVSEEIETEKDGKKVKEKRVIQPKREKGNSYALRYEEALTVECMYLRRCIARLTARIEQLEKEREAGK